MRPARPLGLVVALLAGLVLVSGCGAVMPGRAVLGRVPADDLALIRLYVTRFNDAGEEGPRPQLAFLRETQEPSVRMPPPTCFGQITLEARMVERTLRAAPGLVPAQIPPGTPVARGALYVVAVSVTASSDGVPVREDVGSKHLVVRDGRVFSYAPCPA